MPKSKTKSAVQKNKTKLPPVTPRAESAAGKYQEKIAKKTPAFVLAQVDPFMSEVMGCKIPDRNTMPSVTNRWRGVFTASTNATGSYACAFKPHAIAGQYLPLSVSAAPAITWSGGVAVDFTCAPAMAQQYAAVRTVAYGIRLKYVGPRTASGGKVHIACVANDYVTDAQGYTFWPTTPAEFENSPWYANYSLNEITEQEIVIPGRRIDEGSFRYRSCRTAVPVSGTSVGGGSIETSDGWGSIILLVEGATASSGVIQIEVCYHFEALVNPVGGSLIAPSPAAKPNTAVLDHSMAVSASQPVSRYVEDGFESIKKVISTVTYGASQAKHLLEMGGEAMAVLGLL